MLICRMGAWRMESDGHLSALELASLEGLRAAEAERAAEAAQERRRVATQVRELKRRAWRRGHAAGRAAAAGAAAGACGRVTEAAAVETEIQRPTVKDSAFERAGRNDPCPCGSGKKFKFCHGK